MNAFLVLVLVTALASVAVGVTQATFTDQVVAAQISATAGSVLSPTGATLVNQPSGVRLSWSPPATGISPQSYDVFRSITSGSYAPTPDANTSSSPWDDTTVADCTTYYYEVESRHTNLVSMPSTEASILADLAAPATTDSAIGATSGISPIAGWVKPGGQYYAYATIDDNCTTDASLSVSFDLTGLGGLTNEAAAVGSWTPVAGGPTYDFKAGPFTADPSLVDGATPGWSVAADDTNGYTPTAAGATVTVDAISPTSLANPQGVSSLTDYYAPEVGYGEIAQGTPFQVYADFADSGSGVATQSAGVTADVSSINAGATAVAMPAGSFATDNGVSFTRRSGALTADSPLAEGTYAISATALDAVGNSTTATHQTEIDNTGLTAVSCTATDNAGGLQAADTNTFTFDDTLDPGMVATGWLGTTQIAFNARLTDGGPGVNDYWDFAGLNLLAGTGSPANGINLQAKNWTPSDWTTSTLDRTAPGQLLITYGGGTNSTRRSTTATATLSATQSDAAGNVLTSVTVPCSSAY